jgi:hypothetical protein
MTIDHKFLTSVSDLNDLILSKISWDEARSETLHRKLAKANEVLSQLILAVDEHLTDQEGA